jgi:hypothetical protein
MRAVSATLEGSMKPALADEKTWTPKLGLDPPGLEGKWVEFLFEVEGKLLLLTGEFVRHSDRPTDSMDILYTGRLAPIDPPASQYRFHLSKSHLGSTAPAMRTGSKADFVMEKPVFASECDRVADAGF